MDEKYVAMDVHKASARCTNAVNKTGNRFKRFPSAA